MTIAEDQALACERFVLEDVSWTFYDQTLRELQATHRHLRVTYDEGRMELMTLGDLHERAKAALGRLLELYALEKDIPLTAIGSLTCRRKGLRKGLEPDEGYYVQTPAPPPTPRPLDLDQYPPPDLAVEVDITHSSLDRQAIYAALGVPELWRYDGQQVIVLLRQDDATYAVAPRSRAFPDLPMDVFNRHLQLALTGPQHQAIRAFRDWLRVP